MVRIFIAKFALVKVSKICVKNHTQEHGIVSILKQERDTFEKNTDRKIIIYTKSFIRDYYCSKNFPFLELLQIVRFVNVNLNVWYFNKV